MDVQVFQVFRFHEEAFLTFFALESVLLRVSLAMAFEIRFLIRPVVAQVTSEPFRARVDQFVTSYVHRAPERFAAFVAAERFVDAVQVLQVFHELPRVAETGSALHALVDRSGSPSSEPETPEAMGCQ